MKLLAIDTSTEMASVALMVGTELSFEEQPSPKTHALSLLPIIDRLLVQSGIQINQLDAIVFGCGPGSFTGLRIACSISKGLAVAHDLGLIPVSSLGAIAYSARERAEHAESAVLAVVDARMQELYWSYFPPHALMATEQVNAVADIQIPHGQPVVLAGVGIDLYWHDFPQALKDQISSKLNLYPNAAAMIRLAIAAGMKPISAAQAQPVYVRNKVTQGDTRG